MRWISELGDDDLDPHLLMWDMHRNVDADAAPGSRTVVKFHFTDIPSGQREWWIVISETEVDVCDHDPGFDVRVTVQSSLRTLTRVWRGDTTWQQALRSDDLRLLGEPAARKAITRWFKLPPLAATPRPKA